MNQSEYAGNEAQQESPHGMIEEEEKEPAHNLQLDSTPNEQAKCKHFQS